MWCDGDPKNVRSVLQGRSHVIGDFIRQGDLRCREVMITAENVHRVLAEEGVGGKGEELDFLSIDIDGNDYHILAAIGEINVRCICIEDNAKFRPPIRWCMP